MNLLQKAISVILTLGMVLAAGCGEAAVEGTAEEETASYQMETKTIDLPVEYSTENLPLRMPELLSKDASYVTLENLSNVLQWNRVGQSQEKERVPGCNKMVNNRMNITNQWRAL